MSQNVLSGLNRAKSGSISTTRALKLNHPGERKRKRCGPSTKLRRKRLHDCVAGFPGEYLVVECGGFCEACRVKVSPKASSLKRHLRSNRHVSGKKQRLKDIEHQQSIVQSMSSYDDEVLPQAETIPEKERVFRIEVVETFLKAGLPYLRHRNSGQYSRSTRQDLPTALYLPASYCSYWQGRRTC